MQCFDTYHLRYKARRRKRYGVYGFLVVGTIIFAALVAKSCDQQEQEALRKSLMSCIPAHKDITNEEWKMSLYFQKKGSKKPVEMAQAVLKTKKPRLMAAIAVVETNGNPEVRRSGYKKRHHGAFQVNPKYWGPVSHDALSQALQAEDALDTFKKTSKGKLTVALNYYGGDSTDAYSKRILAELSEVPK